VKSKDEQKNSDELLASLIGLVAGQRHEMVLAPDLVFIPPLSLHASETEPMRAVLEGGDLLHVQNIPDDIHLVWPMIRMLPPNNRIGIMPFMEASMSAPTLFRALTGLDYSLNHESLGFQFGRDGWEPKSGRVN